MTTQEETRKLMAKERQHQEHLKANMLSRAVEEVETRTTDDMTEQARELITGERQHEQHLEENMLSRAKEEIN